MTNDMAATTPVELFGTLLRESSLVDRVTAQIEDLIMEGKLRVGDQLPTERELSRQFEVSRTVVREAVSRLLARSLLEARPGGGLVISSPSTAAVGRSMTLMLRMGQPSIEHEKVLEVRRLLEVEIAGLAAQRRTDEDLERLEKILIEAASMQHDPIRFPELDVGFHLALAQATHNELFLVLLDAMNETFMRFRQIGYQVPDMPARSLSHHRAILEQVKAGSLAGARYTMCNHLVEAEETVREALALPPGSEHPYKRPTASPCIPPEEEEHSI
jgi:GntR family transcriptional repressor for pyruvate dehydrogenase complex